MKTRATFTAFSTASAPELNSAVRFSPVPGVSSFSFSPHTECSQANFFLVRGGAALTPKTSAGLLDGVTRTFMFEVGQEIGIDVREDVLYPKDLATADEMFITSTTRELSPVVRVDDRIVGSGKPGGRGEK